MPVSKIAIDGLWRCLCPSIDNIAASRTLRPLLSLHNTSIRSNRSNTKLPRPDSRNRLLHTTARHQQDPTPVSRPKYPPKQYVAPGPQYEKLNKIPLHFLHDNLRRLATEPDKYHKIAELVEYLITFREEPALMHYDALIRANADPSHGNAKVVARLMDEMKELGIGADAALYHGALQALAVHPDYILRNRVMQEMKERWFGLSPEGWHHLVVGLLRDKQFESAMDNLEQMENDQIKVQSWLHAIFLYRLCEVGEFDEAFRILKKWWINNEPEIDSTIYYTLLDSFSRGFHYEGTKFIWHNRVRTSYINPSDGICLAVLNLAARNGDTDLATSALRMLSNRRSVLSSYHYEALLEAYVNAQDLETALSILSIMSKAGIEPDASTTRSLYLYLFKSVNLPIEACKILESMCKKDEVVPTGAVNVILEAFSAQKNIDKAISLYKQMHTICESGPNTETFNIMLRHLPEKAMKETAMFLAAEMRALKVRPDKLTYDRLIINCLYEIDYEDAFRYLEEMKRVGASRGETWWMRTGTVSALVRKCTEVGDERAWGLLEEMEKMGMPAAGRLKPWVEENYKGDGGPERMSNEAKLKGWNDFKNYA